MIIFQGALGRVIRLNDPATFSTTSLLRLDNTPIDFSIQKSFITRVTVSQKVNVQFAHAVGAQIYVYVFGDRMGAIGLSGLSFAESCDFSSRRHGAEEMLIWYKRFRLSRNPFPVRIMIGEIPIEGFMTDFQQDIVDPGAAIVQWSASLQALTDPEPPRPSQSGAASSVVFSGGATARDTVRGSRAPGSSAAGTAGAAGAAAGGAAASGVTGAAGITGAAGAVGAAAGAATGRPTAAGVGGLGVLDGGPTVGIVGFEGAVSGVFGFADVLVPSQAP